ncbi:unnamed protein product, partial [Urochloa humidicola]
PAREDRFICGVVGATPSARLRGGSDGDARLPPPVAALFAGDLFS